MDILLLLENLQVEELLLQIWELFPYVLYDETQH